MVTLISGANEQQLPLEGRTVQAVRDAFSDIFNIPAGAVATVDGEAVDGDYELEAGETLRFSNELAEKGAKKA